MNPPRAFVLGSTEQYRETLLRKATAANGMTGALEDWLLGRTGTLADRQDVAQRLCGCLYNFLTADLQAQLEAIDNLPAMGPTIEDLAEAQRRLEQLRARKQHTDRLVDVLTSKGMGEACELLMAGLFPTPLEDQIADAERELSEVQRAIEAKLPPK